MGPWGRSLRSVIRMTDGFRVNVRVGCSETSHPDMVRRLGSPAKAGTQGLCPSCVSFPLSYP